MEAVLEALTLASLLNTWLRKYPCLRLSAQQTKARGSVWTFF